MKKKESFYQVLIIGLVIAVIVSFVRINSLKSDISLLEHSLSNETSRLGTQISSIYDNVDNQLKKEASLFASIKRDFGELKTETGMADIKIAVVPKVVTDNMKVNVSLCGKTVEMTKSDNGEYSATIPVGLFENDDTFPLVTITANGETKIEYLENESVQGIFSNYLPTMSGSNLHPLSATLTDGKLTIDGQFFIGYSLGDVSNKAEFTNYALVTEVNGKEIAKKDITDTIEKYQKRDSIEHGEVNIEFKETYDLSGEKNISFCIYIVAEDSLGYIHKKLAFSWQPPDEEGRQAESAMPVGYAGEIILDKEGNILFGKEF